jgi:hypothetical protein
VANQQLGPVRTELKYWHNIGAARPAYAFSSGEARRRDDMIVSSRRWRLEWLLAARPFLANRDRQTVGIYVLGHSCAKDLRRLLNAGHLVLEHPSVKVIEVRDRQTGTAPPGRHVSPIVSFRIGPSVG